MISTASPTSRVANPTHVAALLATFALIAIALLRFPPEQYSFYPRCPFFLYLHLQCPGCGGTRALAALLHGHLRQALHLNALTTLLLPLALLYPAHRSSQLRNNNRRHHPPTYATLTLFALAILFTIARNLPT